MAQQQGYCKEEIDGYIIFYNKIIGKGAFGIVYECRNKNIEGPLCVKVIQSQQCDKSFAQREFDILRCIMKVDNPNVIQVLHLAQENNIWYIFMRKYSQNLQQWLDRKKEQQQIISLEDIFKIIYQIVNGYKFLYDNKIIHRDLKPENILIGDDGLLKITDFGLAKINENLESIYQQTMLGTLAFCSPEIQIHGIYSSKTDVYSLGVLIYVITFGKHFIQAQAQLEFLAQLKKLLDNKQIKLPSIQNPGDQSKVDELIDFFKLTITYDESDRLDWKTIFQWFLPQEGLNNYKLQMSQQLSKQRQQVDQFLESRQSGFIQNNRQQQEKLNQSFKYQIREANLLESSVQQNYEQFENSQEKDQQYQSQMSKRQKSQQNSNNFQKSQSFQQNQDLYRNNQNSSKNQSNENPFSKMKTQSTTTTSQMQDFANLESSQLQQVQTFNISNKFQITEEKDYSSIFIEKVPVLSSQSIISFRSEQSIQQPKLISLKAHNGILTKRKTNKVNSFIKLIFAKARIADQTQEYLQKIIIRPPLKSNTLRNESYTLQGLQMLLVAYKYSLILNGYLIAFDDTMKKDTFAWKQLSKEITPPIVQDYIFNLDEEIQQQKQNLLQCYESARLDLEVQCLIFYKNFICQFINLKNSQFNDFQALILKLLNDQSSYWNYNSFQQLYGGIFKTLFSKFNFQYTDSDLVKFFAYSLKYIRLEDEYQLNKFFTADLESLILNEDHQMLLENINHNAPYIQWM